MNEFEALGSSLLQQVVAYIGEDHLQSVRVLLDDHDSSADVAIGLRNDVWEEQSRAIDKMIEIREMFMDEVAMEYHFVRAETSDVMSSESAFTAALI